MEVILKGSAIEIANLLAILNASPAPAEEPASPVSPQAPVATTFIETSEDVPPKAMNVDAIDPMKAASPEAARNIRNLVLTHIANHPALTNNEIAQALKLTDQQSRTAIKNFMMRGLVRPEKEPNSRMVRYSVTPMGNRYLSGHRPEGETERRAKRPPEEQQNNRVVEYLSEHPNSTSTHLSEQLNLRGKNVSSTLAKLKAAGVIEAEGKGGARDPFRYRLRELSEA